MKNYKKILAVIFIFALILNVCAFADNGYSVVFEKDTSGNVVVNEPEIDIMTDATLAVQTGGKYPSATASGIAVKSFNAWSKGTASANNPAEIGDIGFYNLPSATNFQSVLSGNIANYDLVMTFQKGSSYAYIQNIEVGLGNSNAKTGTVVKTYPVLSVDPSFNYATAANGTEWTITVSVAAILNSGTETVFSEGAALNASNINSFAVKASYCRASTATAQVLKFSSIQFVPRDTGSNTESDTTATVSLISDPGLDNIITDATLAVKANGKYPATTLSGTAVKSFGSWSKGVVAANNPASVGEIGYYNLPSATNFKSVLSSDISSYDLVMTFTKGASYTYIQDIEVGLGNSDATTGTVVKTYPILSIDPTFNYSSAANGTEWTITVNVGTILSSGTETVFSNGASLTANNINSFVVKGTYCRASSATAQMLKFSKIGFVPHNGGGASLGESYTLINAFYDADGKLLSMDFDANSPASLLSQVPIGAYKLKNFVFSNLNDLRPIYPKNETLVPINGSVLFIGGRGAVDSSSYLRALAQAEGFDINADCIYVSGRSLQDHWRNVCAGETDYNVMLNGNYNSDLHYSIQSALEAKTYDWVILEQVSGYAGAEDTVFPYLEYLKDFVKSKCPRAMVFYNTLWPYSSEYTGSVFGFYDNSPATMNSMINGVAEYIDDETDIGIINTNDIIYGLANTDDLTVYSKETNTTFYRLNASGKAAVHAKIFHDLTHTVPSATSLIGVFSITSAEANTILSYFN